MAAVIGGLAIGAVVSLPHYHDEIVPAEFFLRNLTVCVSHLGLFLMLQMVGFALFFFGGGDDENFPLRCLMALHQNWRCDEVFPVEVVPRRSPPPPVPYECHVHGVR